LEEKTTARDACAKARAVALVDAEARSCYRCFGCRRPLRVSDYDWRAGNAIGQSFHRHFLGRGGNFSRMRFPCETHCVIDGDTIDYQGQRIRMVDYDTPEIGEPKCASEEALGHKAKHRLIEILNSGPVAVTPQGDRDMDKYGRKLRLVTVNGQSVGDTLIAEGLAVPWEGHRHYWCG
jgi:endonuclease YncB( thermonuclease family)